MIPSGVPPNRSGTLSAVFSPHSSIDSRVVGSSDRSEMLSTTTNPFSRIARSPGPSLSRCGTPISAYCSPGLSRSWLARGTMLSMSSMYS